MSVNRHALGKRIQIQRKRKGMSQFVFSERIDKTPTFVSYVENGNKSMSMDTFIDMVNALETTPNELLKDSVDCCGTDNSSVLPYELGDCSDNEKRLLTEVLQAVRQIASQNTHDEGFGHK